MRGDSFPLGFILGLLFPVLGFFGYGGIYVTAIRPHHPSRGEGYPPWRRG